MNRPVSLRRRLIMGMLGLVALGLVALGALTYFVLERISLKEAGNTVTTTLHAATGALADLRVQAPFPTKNQLTSAMLPLLSSGTQALIWLPDDGDPLVVTYFGQPDSVVAGVVDQVRSLSELAHPDRIAALLLWISRIVKDRRRQGRRAPVLMPRADSSAAAAVIITLK